MTLKILVWNAQHFDNQSKPAHSTAYTDKLSFLVEYLQKLEGIDVIVLLETGKTGNTNQTVALSLKILSQAYVPITHLGQDGGARKNTTLASSVYISGERFGEFAMPEFDFVLGENEQRAPLIIKHKNTKKLFAFYHANANEKTSYKHIMGAIEYIKELGSLAFFGGDLNYDYAAMNDTLLGLHKLGPSSPGYTHSKFTPIHTSRLYEAAARKHEFLINNQKLGGAFKKSYAKAIEQLSALQEKKTVLQSNIKKSKAGREATLEKRLKKWDDAFAQVDEQFDRQYSFYEGDPLQQSVVVTSRFLDYAFVDILTDWSAECDGSINVDVSQGIAVHQRLCAGREMRSDHFPVVYTYTGV